MGVLQKPFLYNVLVTLAYINFVKIVNPSRTELLFITVFLLEQYYVFILTITKFYR